MNLAVVKNYNANVIDRLTVGPVEISPFRKLKACGLKPWKTAESHDGGPNHGVARFRIYGEGFTLGSRRIQHKFENLHQVQDLRKY